MPVRSVRVTLDAAITDEAWQKFLRKLMVAAQECGVTTTVTAAYSVRSGETDNILVTVTA